MPESRLKALIADQNVTFVMYLSILLGRMGVDKVIPSESAEETLKLIKIVTPDVIILSADMADMDGLSTLKKIRAQGRFKDTPVMLIARKEGKRHREECARAGCAAYLVKPLKLDDLHEALEECLSRSRGFRRRGLRTSFEKKVAVACNGDKKDYYAVSLAEEGMYLRAESPPQAGTEVVVRIPLEGRRSVSLRGKVIYQSKLFGKTFRMPPGMAVDFTKATKKQKEALRALIRERLVRDIIEESGDAVLMP